jgi:hypothetical protein
MEFDYQKYSLEQLDNWINDALSSAEIPPQQIYETIVNSVEDNIQCYQKQLDSCKKLLSLLGKSVD